MAEKSKLAELLFHEKLTLATGLIREIKVWRMPKSPRYPDGVKYRMALVDPTTGDVLILYDNHWPKGHHVHRAEVEEPYEFASVADLMMDFLRESTEAERLYRENKENKNQV